MRLNHDFVCFLEGVFVGNEAIVHVLCVSASH